MMQSDYNLLLYKAFVKEVKKIFDIGKIREYNTYHIIHT